MTKRKIVEKDGKRYVAINLTKPYLIEGEIVGSKDSKYTLLVEEDGVIDTIQTNADIASASAGDFDAIYDKASMSRMRYAMEGEEEGIDADDIPLDTPITMTMEDVMTPEEKMEMKRRMAKMNDGEDDKLEMRRRLSRMRARMDKEDDDGKDKDKMDKEEDKDEDTKKEMRRRMLRARMRARMAKDEEEGKEKDKMDKEEDEEDKK